MGWPLAPLASEASFSDSASILSDHQRFAWLVFFCQAKDLRKMRRFSKSPAYPPEWIEGYVTSIIPSRSFSTIFFSLKPSSPHPPHHHLPILHTILAAKTFQVKPRITLQSPWCWWRGCWHQCQQRRCPKWCPVCRVGRLVI